MVKDKCVCPILATHIVFGAMLLEEDSAYGRLTPKQINRNKKDLSKHLLKFEDNKCGVYSKPPHFGSADSLIQQILTINDDVPISGQERMKFLALESANDWALDNTRIQK